MLASLNTSQCDIFCSSWEHRNSMSLWYIDWVDDHPQSLLNYYSSIIPSSLSRWTFATYQLNTYYSNIAQFTFVRIKHFSVRMCLCYLAIAQDVWTLTLAVTFTSEWNIGIDNFRWCHLCCIEYPILKSYIIACLSVYLCTSPYELVIT